MRAYRGYEQVRAIVPFSLARAGASFTGHGRASRAGATHFLGSNGNSLVLGVLRRAIRHFRLWNGALTVGLEADCAGPPGWRRRHAGQPGTFPVGAGSDRWSARCWFRSARAQSDVEGAGQAVAWVGRGVGAHARGSTGFQLVFKVFKVFKVDNYWNIGYRQRGHRMIRLSAAKRTAPKMIECDRLQYGWE
jgi:hypothetical protein